MTNISTTAMVLAAGLGQRMRPLTLSKPKPLYQVGGRTMLDSAIDKLREAGIQRVVVNCFYLAEQIEAHLSARHDIDIIISRETELLDTGGGIKNALHHFGGLPFFALNADLPWQDEPHAPSLPRMAAMWEADKMDALLLLMPTHKARGFSATGDFALTDDGHAHRHAVKPPHPYVMLSAQILKPDSFAPIKERVFSNNLIWNAAEAQNRLYGLVHRGTCYHVGTPEDWQLANELLESGQGW